MAEWKDICSLYGKLAAESQRFAPMLALTTAIEQSRYSHGVFARTSHVDLVIRQTESSPGFADQFEPHLVISLLSNGMIHFRYIDTPDQAKQWTRTVEGHEAFARFELFVKQLHWFA